MPEKMPKPKSGKLMRGVVFLVIGILGWFVVPLITQAFGHPEQGDMVFATMAVMFVGRALAAGLAVAGVIVLLSAMIND